MPRRLYLFAALLLSLPLACSRGPEEETPPPATVKWESAAENVLEEWTELIGTTVPLPDRVARISSPVEGRVVSVGGSADMPVTEGHLVKKGTVLVQLDTTVIKANLARLEATQPVLQEDLKQAQIAQDVANHDLERLQGLLKDSTAAGRDSLVPRPELRKAEFALEDAKSKLKAASGRLGAGTKEVEALKEQLHLFTLAAPINGRLGRIQVVAGQTLSVGALIADVTDIEETIDVLCFVPPSMVGRLAKGQTARLGPIDQDSAVPVTLGQIEFIAEQAEPETGNFAVKVRFPNSDAHLRANSVLRLCVNTKEGKACLSLPEAAVQEDEEHPTVVIVQETTRKDPKTGKMEPAWIARRMEVVLGVRDRALNRIEIVSLSDPEKKEKIDVKDALFVVEGAQGLQTGDYVKQETDDE
jgi:RND family efflux transporter MFP subunit